MLTKVEVLTASGTTLSLPLQDVGVGFLVADIEGLDPVEATIVSSPFGNLDGTEYQSSRRGNRNIVIKLGLTPDFISTSVADLRSILYGYLMPKSNVLMKFYMDDVLFVEIQGRVESLRTAIFAKEPVVAISLLCFKPDFVAPASVVVDGNTVSATTEQVILYPGTIETGFLLTLNVDRTLGEFMVYNRLPSGETPSMEFVAPLLAGDILKISSVSGNKFATLTRGGIDIPILYGVSPVAAWINLFPGENNFRVQASGAAIPFTIEYLAKYGGL